MTMRIHGDKIEFPDGTEQFTASSGGGSEAQPPVAFSLRNPNPFTNVAINETDTEVPFSEAIIDTENGKVGNTYVVKKEGIYNLQFKLRITGAPSKLQYALARLKVNGNQVSVSSFDYSNNFSNASSPSGSYITSLAVGDVISLAVVGKNPDGNVNLNLGDFTSLSGHMVSSITEGEVKEKEAVVVTACNDSVETTIPNNTWTVVKFPKTLSDDNNYFDSEKFIPKEAGWYYINSNIYYASNVASGSLVTGIFRNGNLTYSGEQLNFASSTNPPSNVSGLVYMDGLDDYVQIKTHQSSGSEASLFKGAPYQTFNAHLITGQSTGGGSETGGKTVAYRAHLPATIDAIVGDWTEIPLTAIDIDTDNAVVDNEFTIKTAGCYQINATVTAKPNASSVVARIFKTNKDGVKSILAGSSHNNIEDGSARGVVTTDLAYLDVGDTLGLEAEVVKADGGEILGMSEWTNLSAVLVSGGSASGDSATLESLGIANHDKVVVEPLANKNLLVKLEGDTSTWGFRVEQSSAFGMFNFTDNKWSYLVNDDGSHNFYTPSNVNAMKIDTNGRVDITGSLYVNNTPKSVDSMLVDLEKDVKLKDKLIEKLSARLDELEKKVK